MKKSIGSKIGFSIGITILFAILTLSNSCTKDSTMYGMGSNSGSSGSPGTNEVWIEGMAFNPLFINLVA